MSSYFDAFEMGPLAERGPEAVAPEVFRGIYAMPMFVTIPTPDLTMSADFWVQGLGFIELFSIPGQLVHLRRWAFQDVLLVPAGPGRAEAETPPMSVSFSCVMSQLDPAVEACTELLPGSVTGPRDTPWRTRDVEVVTPEGARVVLTAAREHDPDSPEARYLAEAGIVAPEAAE
jgi:catechol 2,3-dioxygenase-like lactoylglutathione lyase family enzyme